MFANNDEGVTFLARVQDRRRRFALFDPRARIPSDFLNAPDQRLMSAFDSPSVIGSRIDGEHRQAIDGPCIRRQTHDSVFGWPGSQRQVRSEQNSRERMLETGCACFGMANLLRLKPLDENRYRRLTNHLPGNAAQENLIEKIVAARADDNKIDALCPGDIQQLVSWSAASRN